MRVHGLDGLQLINASGLPAATSTNTNAPTVMTRLADCVAAWPRAQAVRCASSLSRRAQAAAALKIPQVAVMWQPRR
jgi:choline dehydrogenase-like flavoprotein